MSRVGQNHIYTVYFWQGNHRIYGHIRCIYTVLANPKDVPSVIKRRAVQCPDCATKKQHEEFSVAVLTTQHTHTHGHTHAHTYFNDAEGEAWLDGQGLCSVRDRRGSAGKPQGWSCEQGSRQWW